MSRPPPDLSIPVGVVVERRRASSPWIDVVWRPAAVLPGLPDAAPWTVLEGDAALARVYAGVAAIALFHGDAASYRDNLATGAPLLWVVLRPSERAPPFEIVAVTADPSEGESYTEAGADLVDSVPMPASIEAAVAGFVAEHPIEQVFVKRARDRADPQRLARRTATEKGGKP